MTRRSRRAVVFGLTFIVAFCSIVYELVYSELLTVIFGGTVVRYSITIGLFLFSFGVGSLLYSYLDEDAPNFLRVEVVLSLVGPLGLVFIVLVNSVDLRVPGVNLPLLVSHVPIVLVGLLSGFEVPLLTAMTDESEGFSKVLGVDYIGSLAGTVVYALVLYPELGLIPAIFVLGLLNALAAVGFALRFETTRVLLAAALLIAASFVGVLAGSEQVEETLTRTYLRDTITDEYATDHLSVDITDHVTTRYQDVVLYERQWTGPPGRWQGPPKEKCLRLDDALQLCDSWADSYHSGLVDVPMTFFENGSDVNVLLVGGGDWIAADHLRKYGVSVDHVDIDRRFMEYAKRKQYFEQYHHRAYEYEKLNTVTADAFSYLRNTDEQYDLVLLDVPGIRNDDLMKLYSTEFYSQLRRHLTERGLVVTWAYSRASFRAHHKTYVNTVRDAGFSRYFPYYAYDDLDRDGDTDRVERFYVLAPGERRSPTLDAGTEYVRRYEPRYRRLDWRQTPHYRGIEVNSIFDPNYDIIVEY